MHLSLHLHGHLTVLIIAKVTADLLIFFLIAQLTPVGRRESQLGARRRELDG